MTYAAVNGLNLYYEVHGGGDTAEKWTRGSAPLTCRSLPPIAACLPTASLIGPLSSDPRSRCATRNRASREEMQGSKARTLIIAGDGDIVTPEHAIEMFRTIPGAQLSVVPHAARGILPKEIMTLLNETAVGGAWPTTGARTARPSPRTARDFARKRER